MAGKLSQFPLAAQQAAAKPLPDLIIEEDDEPSTASLPVETAKPLQEKHTMGNKKYPEIVTGQKFGELTVKVLLAERDKVGQKQYLCGCSCGQEKIASQYLLNSGQTKSCGHLRRQGRSPGIPNGNKLSPPIRANKSQTKTKSGKNRVQEQAEHRRTLQEGMPKIPDSAKMTAFHAAADESLVEFKPEELQPDPEPQRVGNTQPLELPKVPVVEESQAPAIVEQPVQAITPRTTQTVDLKATAQQIEGLTQLFKAIPLANVAAVRDELRRLKEQTVSPLFDDSEKLAEYLDVTNWFYESRAALEVIA